MLAEEELAMAQLLELSILSPERQFTIGARVQARLFQEMKKASPTMSEDGSFVAMMLASGRGHRLREVYPHVKVENQYLVWVPRARALYLEITAQDMQEDEQRRRDVQNVSQ